MNPAQTVATDFQSGSIDRFRSLPIPRSAYLLGHFFAEMLGSLLTIAILLGTGLIVGWRTHASVLDPSASSAGSRNTSYLCSSRTGLERVTVVRTASTSS